MLTAPERRLALLAYDEMLARIMSGALPPGTPLNERGLAELLGMSRTPVREALLMLEAETLVVRHGRGGLFVREQRIEELLDALDVRLMLEPEAAAIATGRVDAATLERIGERLRTLIGVARAGRSIERANARAVDDALHDAIGRAFCNEQFAGIVRALRRRTSMFDLKSVPERALATCEEHLAIVTALSNSDPNATRQAMRAHLEGVRASIVARLVKKTIEQ